MQVAQVDAPLELEAEVSAPSAFLNWMSPVALVMTDIEASTDLWERAPEAMAAALLTHNSLVRDGLARHGGDGLVQACGALSREDKTALE